MILLTALYYYYLFLEWQISTSVAVVVQLAAQCTSPVLRQVLVRPRNLGTVEDLMNVRTICNSSGCTETVGWVIRPVKTVGRITYIVLAQT